MGDRIRRAFRLPSRIPGADYTDEFWGDIPPADPHTHINGVHVDMAGVEVRSRILTPPLPALEPIAPPAPAPGEDWDAIIRAAKERSTTLSTMPTPPQPVPAYAAHRMGRAAAARTTPDEEWEQVIRSAKLKAAEEEDWDALIRRAKTKTKTKNRTRAA